MRTSTPPSSHERGQTIDIKDFVDYDEIDPIYFERTYRRPDEGAERVYAPCSSRRWTSRGAPRSPST
jgi:hypothetical protein